VTDIPGAGTARAQPLSTRIRLLPHSLTGLRKQRSRAHMLCFNPNQPSPIGGGGHFNGCL